MHTSHPFDALTPDCVLDALDSVGLRGDGRLLALNSYENRVYQVYLEDGAIVVAKFYRPNTNGARWTDAQIQEEHDYSLELAAAEIPVVAPLNLGAGTLAHFNGFRFSVTPKKGGRAPELDDPYTLEWIGRFIGRIHAIGGARAFEHRERVDVATFGIAPRDWLLANDWVPPEVRGLWSSAVNKAIDIAQACFDKTADLPTVRLHGDCHPGNILWTPETASAPAGPHFVDFDDARQGPPAQDLWMLLSGDRADMTRQLSDVLAGYEDFMTFDRRQLYLIEALRTLRMIHYSTWLARRWDDPAFPVNFPWFNTGAYWQEQVQLVTQQCDAMQAPVLMV
jgi:Ser/Thr protein kinase RdoA (MazF antagonist)